MSFLYLLESMRNGFLDSLMSVITVIGEETVFIVIGLLFFWCIDKYEGYYILSVGFIGTVCNQFLKILCRVPRPWVRDPNFTIVESAREAATGYSFPSGHTQSSVGSFGAIARWSKKRAVRIICTVLCVLVPFSRMYLGVHTPADVAVAAATALLLIFGLYPIVKAARNNKKIMWVLIAVMFILVFGFLLFTEFYNFPAGLDEHNYTSALKNAYTLTGCILGLAVIYYLDEYHTHFETSAVWWAQLIKFIGGVIIVLAIKELLRAPLSTLCGGHMLERLIRYFLVVLFAGGIWPLTFKWFSRLGKHK